MKDSPYQAPTAQAQAEKKVAKLEYDKSLMFLVLLACVVVILTTVLAFTYRYRLNNAGMFSTDNLELHKYLSIIFLEISGVTLACGGLAAACLLFKKYYKAGILSLVVLGLMTLLYCLLIAQNFWYDWS